MAVKTFSILAFVFAAQSIYVLQQRDLLNGSYSTLKLNLSSSTIDNATDEYFNTTTSFKIYGCNGQQQYQLNLATQNVVELASSVFSDSELKKRDENISIVAKQKINFKTQAAIDYFGPYSQNAIYQENITNVLINMAWRGGWGDWWYDRRVILTCQDIKSICNKPGNAGLLAASYYKPEPQDPAHYNYPTLVFCPVYFDNYLPHPIIWNYLKQHKEFQNNVLNLQSQAGIMFHEILHIRSSFHKYGKAEVCPQGCDDIPAYLDTTKPENEWECVKVYGPGFAKLMAQDKGYGPLLSSHSNDNFLFHVLSRFMQKNFGSYPQHPQAWEIGLSKAQNEAKYDTIGRFPSNDANSEDYDLVSDDSDAADPSLPTFIPSGPFPASDYPPFYQSILAEDGATTTATTTTAESTTTHASTTPASSTTISKVAAPTPSQAIIFYRRDVCIEHGSEICHNVLLGYTVLPEQWIENCTRALKPDFSLPYPTYHAPGDTSVYTIDLGPFDIPGALQTGCYYSGSSATYGEVTCPSSGWWQVCLGPFSARVLNCGVDGTDTPIAFAEW